MTARYQPTTTEETAQPNPQWLADNDALKERIDLLQAEVQFLRQQLHLAKRRLFGPSSEQLPPEILEGLFNDAEVYAEPQEPERQTVKSHQRKKPRPREERFANLPREVVRYQLSAEEQICPHCGCRLHPIGEEVHEELEYIPASVVVKEIHQDTYACGHCHAQGDPTPVLTAPQPPSAFPGSFATPSLVSAVLTQKFVDGLPLYRQEQIFARLGVELSRQTLANWMLKAAEWFEPLYERMRQALLARDNLKADETTVQVLHEPGRSASSQSYMWLYRSGRDGPHILLFEYQPSRAREHPATFLRGFHGYLQTDGYSAYEKIEGVRLVGCWSHARRKFVEALSHLPKAQQQAGGTATHQGLAYIDRLFAIERELRDLPPEERRLARLARSRPVLDAFKKWREEQELKVLPKSPLGAALTYLRNQWEKLTAFLEDGRLDLDNNSSERAIRPFAVGRKNWLFANTVRGAQASATLYSLVRTAIENGLNPQSYVMYLLEQLPNSTTSQLDSLLPWSPSLPETLRAPGQPPPSAA